VLVNCAFEHFDKRHAAASLLQALQPLLQVCGLA
jgi:hypothetical protein